MSSISSRPITTSALEPASRIRPQVLWRIGGTLALAHVVLMFAGITQEVITEHGTPLGDFVRIIGGANASRVYAGGYLESLAFLVLVPALVLVALGFSRRTEVGRIAAATFVALGTAYVASTLAVGFPPGAAAMYGLQHGADPHSAAMLMDVRNFAFILQVAISCAMALALGIAALAEQVHVRWVGWGGVVVGTAGLVVVPLGHNIVSMAWLVWWVGLAVLFLRGSAKPRETAVDSPSRVAS